MSGQPTIDQALEAFLDEQRERLTPRTFRNYEVVVSLLRNSLNRYGYMALTADEERRWRAAFDAGDNDAFTKVIGAERILEHYGEFLGYYMVSKVLASEELLRAAGTVTKKLARWLDEHGYADPVDVGTATQVAAEAGRDLPKAERLATILYDWAEARDAAVDPDAAAEGDVVDEYLQIDRVERGRIWFERGFGPVEVPEEASDLARPGWTVNVVLARTADRWELVEVGNVYP